MQLPMMQAMMHFTSAFFDEAETYVACASVYRGREVADVVRRRLRSASIISRTSVPPDPLDPLRRRAKLLSGSSSYGWWDVRVHNLQCGWLQAESRLISLRRPFPSRPSSARSMRACHANRCMERTCCILAMSGIPPPPPPMPICWAICWSWAIPPGPRRCAGSIFWARD
jgi:hypothetical protein